MAFRLGRPAVAALISTAALVLAGPAAAVPSFARQMNTQCDTCHTRFPALNAFGRAFKLNAYTLTADPGIQAQDAEGKDTLSLSKLPPLSVMVQLGWTQLNKSNPSQQNDSVQFPQEFSIFLAGRLTPKVGAFVQYTYSQSAGNSEFDNTEFRFADTGQLFGQNVTYGVTANNSPTLEDLWNSTPVWGFPYATTESGVSPLASTLLDGGLAQDVAGVGGYSLWNDHLYIGATLYRSAHQGSSAPDFGSENTIDQVAPYWRVAWQQQFGANYLEVGTYGIHAELYPEGFSGPTNNYTDIAGDFQFERPIGRAQLTVHGTWINEQQTLNATYTDGTEGPSKLKNDLDTYRLDAEYALGDWQYALGYFLTNGTQDAGLYPVDAEVPVNGSANGKPNTEGLVGQVAYYPWQNTAFTLQYTAYNQFNGQGSNYDGAGRSASNNNTLFVNAWLMW